MNENDAPGLGRSNTATATDVLLMHAYHECEDGQNTAACGHRFGSDRIDPTGMHVETCGVCLDFIKLPCGRWHSMTREPDLTAMQAAEELQVCAKTVRTLCAQGKIVSYRVGVTPGSRTAPIRIRRRDLEKYKDSQQGPSRR
ncbi:helix-turn-helix domain-containing protein [Arthrobacter sp. efr-133-TYG-118]|uniref:helix-turn-helix domain-containing protein n=1 Tax=Arthrobacter sp. efr-133-TYG-118 TaxID=3040279 RepID=UPI00254B046D|nr:helix-turn-helix domain-containing protein [Arthrobacter sp. efr-133-TYG-118]